jgi:NAD(P)-dependent dehydrogenase (short-subunit alcohol dehydrogenase family)/acyl dehydratase
VTRTLRLTTAHLEQFAEASGDWNPLHTDSEFARETPYGRCIAHGALVVISALGIAEPQRLEKTQSLHVSFKQPVFPDEEYTIEALRSDEDGFELTVSRGGRPAVTVRVSTGETALPATVGSSERRAEMRTVAQSPSVSALAEGGGAIGEAYGCDIDALARLAEELDAGTVPAGLLLWLAAASYVVGMVVPGKQAVFAGARIGRAASARSGALTGRVSTADDRMGLVVLEVALEDERVGAEMTLQAFMRTPVPPPTRASLAEYLPPSDRLAGQNVLAIGASRGLGAALAGGLAEQGATVWAAFANRRDRAEALEEEFGSDSIRPLQLDATDPVWTREALEHVRAAGPLQGLALCAAPPLHEEWVHPQTVDTTLRFITASIAAALVPLAEVVATLDDDGWICIASSAAVEDPPEGWPHYLVAKAALEGLAAYCQRHIAARVLVVRAPRMWTDSVNTPLGRLGAVPKEQIAAAIVDWVLADGAPGASGTLTPEELLRPRA